MVLQNLVLTKIGFGMAMAMPNHKAEDVVRGW